MARTKGGKNKKPARAPATLDLAIQERIQLIANLIVDTMDARMRSETAVAGEFDEI